MARSKKNSAASGDQVVHLHVGNGDTGAREADAEEVEALDAMEDGQLSRAVDEIRQVEGAKAEVYRMAPGERQGHCRTYPVSMFSLERVASDYGPGKYRVRFKGPGDKYVKGGGTFDIAESLQNPNTPGGVAPNAIQDFIALMKERDARELADREKKTGQWIEWAKIIAPLALPKILDMIGGGAAKGTSLPDMIRAVKDLKEIQAPQQDLKSQFGEVVSILQGAKELVGDDGGKQATGSTWVDLIRDLAGSPAAGALVQALSGTMPRPAALPLPSPSVVAPRLPNAIAPPPPAASAACVPNTAPEFSPLFPAQPDVNLLAQLQWLRGTLSQLLVQAGKGSNPRLYAEVLLDNLPAEITTAQLFERLDRDDWLIQLAQLDSQVHQHAQWLGRFREQVLRAIRRQARKAAETAPEPGETVKMPAGLPQANQPMAEGDAFE